LNYEKQTDVQVNIQNQDDNSVHLTNVLKIRTCKHTCESVVQRCPDGAKDQSGGRLATSF